MFGKTSLPWLASNDRGPRKSPVLVVAEMKSATDACSVPVVEFTRFILGRERTEELVFAHAQMVNELALQRGLVAAYLVRVGDREWIDLTIWESEPDADASIVRDPGPFKFFGLVEGILGQERGTLVSPLLGPVVHAPRTHG